MPDPELINALKDLPVIIAILAAVVSLGYLVYLIVCKVKDIVDTWVKFLATRDSEYQANVSKLVTEQNQFWALALDNHQKTWQNFVREMGEKILGSDADMSKGLSALDISIAKSFAELRRLVGELGERLEEHDRRTRRE